jgi:hypothetical protein
MKEWDSTAKLKAALDSLEARQKTNAFAVGDTVTVIRRGRVVSFREGKPWVAWEGGGESFLPQAKLPTPTPGPPTGPPARRWRE